MKTKDVAGMDERLPLIEWVKERHANCIRLADSKRDADRVGWLLDAGYFAKIITLLTAREAVRPAADTPRLPEADELAAEIARAEMHGKIFASAHEAKGVLDEELEEFWEWVMMKRKDRVASEMHKELIQLAAMAIKAIRSMENFVGGDV